MLKKFSEMTCLVIPDGEGTFTFHAEKMTRKQVAELEVMFVPRAKRWRGQYREMAAAIVAAVRGLAIP